MKARKEAWLILKAVILEKKYANLLLRSKLGSFSSQDKAYITQVVYGTLQNFRYLRASWQRFVPNSLSEDISILLDMLCYQILFLDKTPDYAILNDTVEIAKGISFGKYAGLVNAVGKKVIKEEQLNLDDNTIEGLALKTSHPEWLVSLWKSHLGFAKTKELCYFNNNTAKVTLRVNRFLTTKEELLKSKSYQSGLLSDDALYYDGTLFSNDDFLEKKVLVQDEASQLVGFFVDPKPNDLVLDMCSAPGSKTTHMAMLMDNQGQIVAVDIHAHRIQLLENELEALGIKNVKTLVADSTTLSTVVDTKFDKILLDVPCSGLGTLRHKPDIKIHLEPNDLDSLVVTQQSLLEEASKLLKDNGILVYSTCTINQKENERQIKTFLTKHPDFSLVDERIILPMDYDTDGFYMAKLQLSKNMIQ